MSEKNRDTHGRWRNKTIAFRASEAEAKMIDEVARLSGYTKQDYIISKLLNKDVVVVGNPRVFKVLKEKLNEIYLELIRLNALSDQNEELLETIRFVAKICEEMNNTNKRNEE